MKVISELYENQNKIACLVRHVGADRESEESEGTVWYGQHKNYQHKNKLRRVNYGILKIIRMYH